MNIDVVVNLRCRVYQGHTDDKWASPYIKFWKLCRSLGSEKVRMTEGRNEPD